MLSAEDIAKIYELVTAIVTPSLRAVGLAHNLKPLSVDLINTHVDEYIAVRAARLARPEAGRVSTELEIMMKKGAALDRTMESVHQVVAAATQLLAWSEAQNAGAGDSMSEWSEGEDEPEDTVFQFTTIVEPTAPTNLGVLILEDSPEPEEVIVQVVRAESIPIEIKGTPEVSVPSVSQVGEVTLAALASTEIDHEAPETGKTLSLPLHHLIAADNSCNTDPITIAQVPQPVSPVNHDTLSNMPIPGLSMFPLSTSSTSAPLPIVKPTLEQFATASGSDYDTITHLPTPPATASLNHQPLHFPSPTHSSASSSTIPLVSAYSSPASEMVRSSLSPQHLQGDLLKTAAQRQADVEREVALAAEQEALRMQLLAVEAETERARVIVDQVEGARVLEEETTRRKLVEEEARRKRLEEERRMKKAQEDLETLMTLRAQEEEDAKRKLEEEQAEVARQASMELKRQVEEEEKAEVARLAGVAASELAALRAQEEEDRLLRVHMEAIARLAQAEEDSRQLALAEEAARLQQEMEDAQTAKLAAEKHAAKLLKEQNALKAEEKRRKLQEVATMAEAQRIASDKRRADAKALKEETARLAEEEKTRIAKEELRLAKAKKAEAGKLARIQAKALKEESARLAEERTLRLAEEERVRLAQEESIRLEKAKTAEAERLALEKARDAAKLQQENAVRLAREEQVRVAEEEEESIRIAKEECDRLAKLEDDARKLELEEEAKLARTLTADAEEEAARISTALMDAAKAEEVIKKAAVDEAVARESASRARLLEEATLSREAKEVEDRRQLESKLAESSQLEAEAEQARYTQEQIADAYRLHQTRHLEQLAQRPSPVAREIQGVHAASRVSAAMTSAPTTIQANTAESSTSISRILIPLRTYQFEGQCGPSGRQACYLVLNEDELFIRNGVEEERDSRVLLDCTGGGNQLLNISVRPTFPHGKLN